ncbi:hypothetical protein HanXRQr2_Chr07g0289481 [Helianthus annuus]|uniref:Uncharacterized protein n=1 Tax=Helianthus annuus TaxID=4232 RepID=A0A9K3IJV5_HELAN|nr:hypothetical protein HanXRQr2_Chr07g0289481 [Helianthus annuus]KAJ0549790.1 hypothetical protein HanHA300_Chr07g0238021 [Helianthus annuus]KAJ0562743.1 hypothetical protein HanHA89_Chr07g0255181 [Helianthus annuus]KAJ0728118.1 hypothetical protein HanLR1_Chr07g0237941 [Helianthus annuus]KAJ0730894.1 hypothetical protein HanOQP8_Chr07g0245671 [Helianthus annuus]
MVEPLVNNLEWLQKYGIAHVTNAVLNSTKLDQTVAALIVAARHMGHSEGYTECASHRPRLKSNGTIAIVSLVLRWRRFCQTQDSYNHLALPGMDLVFDALQHDDYVVCLKAIFEVPGDEDFDFDDDEEEDGADGVA